MIVGLAGYKGSGKDTAALAFCLRGYQQISFAGPMKKILIESLQGVLGKSKDFLHPYVYGDLKETIIPGTDTTARQELQSLGDWGRNIHPYFWVNITLSKLQSNVDYVVSDVRFPNEAEGIKSYGGQVFKIERPGHQKNNFSNHVSESYFEDMEYAGILLNDGDTSTCFVEKVYKFIGEEL